MAAASITIDLVAQYNNLHELQLLQYFANGSIPNDDTEKIAFMTQLWSRVRYYESIKDGSTGKLLKKLNISSWPKNIDPNAAPPNADSYGFLLKSEDDIKQAIHKCITNLKNKGEITEINITNFNKLRLKFEKTPAFQLSDAQKKLIPLEFLDIIQPGMAFTHDASMKPSSHVFAYNKLTGIDETNFYFILTAADLFDTSSAKNPPLLPNQRIVIPQGGPITYGLNKNDFEQLGLNVPADGAQYPDARLECTFDGKILKITLIYGNSTIICESTIQPPTGNETISWTSKGGTYPVDIDDSLEKQLKQLKNHSNLDHQRNALNKKSLGDLFRWLVISTVPITETNQPWLIIREHTHDLMHYLYGLCNNNSVVLWYKNSSPSIISY